MRELLWSLDDRLYAIADEAGAYGFVALDLATAFQNPGCLAGIEVGDERSYELDDDD